MEGPRWPPFPSRHSSGDELGPAAGPRESGTRASPRSTLLLESSGQGTLPGPAAPGSLLYSGPIGSTSSSSPRPQGAARGEEALAVPGLWPSPAAANPHYMHLGFWQSVWIRRQTHHTQVSTRHAPCSGAQPAGWARRPVCPSWPSLQSGAGRPPLPWLLRSTTSDFLGAPRLTAVALLHPALSCR